MAERDMLERSRGRRRRLWRHHAGEGIEDNVNVLGFVLLGLGIVGLGLALVAGGYGFGGWALVAGIACVALFAAGGLVIAAEWRQRRTHDPAGSAGRQGH